MQSPLPSEDCLSLNQEQTAQLSSLAVYQKYKQWLRQHGVVVHPSLIYPAYFGETGQGVVGVGTKTTIRANKCLLAVPESLIITCNSAKQDKRLEQIIMQNPHVFTLLNGKQSQFSMLMLFICYHLLLKSRSQYQPYLAVCLLGVSHIHNLPINHAISVGNQTLANLVRETSQRKRIYKNMFTSIFNKYRDLLELDFEEEHSPMLNVIINHAYNIITTRSFGWPMKYRSLVPMADALNHSNFYVYHRMASFYPKSQISLNQEFDHILEDNTKQGKIKNKIQRFVSKHQQLEQSLPLKLQKIKFDDNKPNEKQVSKQKEQTKDRHWRILWHQYRIKIRNIRQLHFYEESCDQDNDTNDDEKEQFEERVWQFKLRQRAAIKQQHALKLKQELLIQYWMIYVDPSFLSYLNTDTIKRSNSSSILEQKEPSSQMSISSRESSTDTQSDESQHQQSQEEQEVHKVNGNSGQSESPNCSPKRYLMMSSPKHSKLSGGSQLFTFYGRRSNTFLLAGYQFLLPHNKYDSYSFRMHLHNWKLHPIYKPHELMPEDIVRTCQNAAYASNRDNLYTKEIRLKKEKLNVELINHCRALLLQSQLPSQEDTSLQIQKQQSKFITIPSTVDSQHRTLTLAQGILQYLKSLVTKPVPVSMTVGSNEQHHGHTMLQQLNHIYADIIDANIGHVRLCSKYLQSWHHGMITSQHIGEQDGNPMRECSRIREYLNSLERSNL